jgi:hypothetical protein
MLAAPVRDVQKGLVAYKLSNRSAPSPGIVDGVWGSHTETAFVYWANATDSGVLPSVRNATSPSLLERIRATRISADKRTVTLDDQLYAAIYAWARRYRAPTTLPAPAPTLTQIGSDAVALPPDLYPATFAAAVDPEPCAIARAGSCARAAASRSYRDVDPAGSAAAVWSCAELGSSALAIGLMIGAGVLAAAGLYYIFKAHR